MPPPFWIKNGGGGVSFPIFNPIFVVWTWYLGYRLYICVNNIRVGWSADYVATQKPWKHFQGIFRGDFGYFHRNFTKVELWNFVLITQGRPFLHAKRLDAPPPHTHKDGNFSLLRDATRVWASPLLLTKIGCKKFSKIFCSKSFWKISKNPPKIRTPPWGFGIKKVAVPGEGVWCTSVTACFLYKENGRIRQHFW